MKLRCLYVGYIYTDPRLPGPVGHDEVIIVEDEALAADLVASHHFIEVQPTPADLDPAVVTYLPPGWTPSAYEGCHPPARP